MEYHGGEQQQPIQATQGDGEDMRRGTALADDTQGFLVMHKVQVATNETHQGKEMTTARSSKSDEQTAELDEPDLEEVPVPPRERTVRFAEDLVQYAEDQVDSGGARGSGGQRTPSVSPQTTLPPHRYGTRRNAPRLQQNSALLAEITQGETSEEEQTDSLTWFRSDKGVQKFVGSGVGPIWDNVWKRSTYNMDNGDLISEELTTAITKEELYRPSSEGVRNIRTVLHYRIKEGETEEKVNESRKENVTFKKPAGDPSEIKQKAKSTPITTHHVTSSTGEKRKKWVASIEKERDVGNYPLSCQIVYVLKPDPDKAPLSGPAMKYKSRMVICGNRQPWEQDESNSTNNIDAPLLRWMLSAFCGKDTTWTGGAAREFRQMALPMMSLPFKGDVNKTRHIRGGDCLIQILKPSIEANMVKLQPVVDLGQLLTWKLVACSHTDMTGSSSCGQDRTH
eukprot:842919-Amphidinium_carterae.1